MKVNGTYRFKDFPDFKPNLSPREIFKLGSFGGTYWRPINSVTGNIKNYHLKYDLKNIPLNYLTNVKYDIKINKYKKKVGSSLEMWIERKWITKNHPYGWVEWYCDFFKGKRCEDDEWQIKRWKNIAGENGRFRKRLISLIHKSKTTYNDLSISPAIRQTLQHWGYKITKADLELIKK